MNSLTFLPAHQLAQMIRDRQVSALEVLDAHLTQIAKHNAKVNAIVTLDETGARQRAKAADAALAQGENWGVLHGVPVTVKDFFETAGMRTTAAYKSLVNYIPAQDATVVARVRSAGAIIMGKTNVPLLGADWQTTSPLFGRTNNPWDLSRTVGGSSGGSGAAVAAGLSPLDLCGDMGGSGRIPAHFCGVFSLKPTEYRVSTAGGFPQILEGDAGLNHALVPCGMARSVEDLKLWLTLVEGPDRRQWQVPPVPSETLIQKPLNEYRLAWTDRFQDIPVTAETRATLDQLTQKLAASGCQVERAVPTEFDFITAWETAGEMISYWMGTRQIPKLPTLLDDLRRLRTLGYAKAGILRGLKLNVKSYAAALVRKNALIAQMENFLSQWDAWLCPVSSAPAFTHCPVGQPLEVDGHRLPYLFGLGAYTAAFSLTGHPVVVLPVGQTKDGLPIGVQLVGQRWRDKQLLDLAEKIVEVTGVIAPVT